MSVKYSILRSVIKATNLKEKMFGGSAEDIIERTKAENAKMKMPQFHDGEIEESKIQVIGFTVLKSIHKQKSNKANMFIIGGGMLLAPRPGAVKKALKFAKETGCDVYIPYYPLCSDYPISKAYEMIHETYKVMLKDYESNNISILGSSSGGNLALGMIAYINDGHGDVPMPAHIIALSPGTCVDNEEEWVRMLALDKKDFLIPAKFMRTAEGILRNGDMAVPEYMIWIQRGDFTNCPKVSFMYGSDETLYACAPTLENVMKKYGVDYEMIVGEGMFHCYPVFPIVKEAKEGWEQMVKLAI